MAGVLVFGDVAQGRLTPASMEVAAAGQVLADGIGEPLLGGLIGHQSGEASAGFRCGFEKLYTAEGGQFETYSAQAYLQAAREIIEACSPSAVLFPHDLQTREWVPGLAARLDCGLVMDCTALAVQGADLVVTKPVYGGGVKAEYVIHGAPRMATIRAGAFAELPPAISQETVAIQVQPISPGRVSCLESVTASASSGGPKLKDAKTIVAGGRGVGGKENWHLIENAAAALGGAIGCSRPVADSGWVPSSYQVGLSGTMVAPDLYIAIGISGAVQHLAGISSAKTVVAINSDRDADIFTRANYGVVGDFREILPAFAERVRQLRS